MNPTDSGDPLTFHICGFEWKVSRTIGWIAVEFGPDIHVPLRMNCNNFGDQLTFSFLSSAIIRSTFLFVQYLVWPNKYKTKDITISLSFTLCLVLISKC